MNESTVASRGVTLRVRSAGDPAGPTVILVHGYPDTSTVWDAVVPHLTARHRVIASSRGPACAGSAAPAAASSPAACGFWSDSAAESPSDTSAESAGAAAV